MRERMSIEHTLAGISTCKRPCINCIEQANTQAQMVPYEACRHNNTHNSPLAFSMSCCRIETISWKPRAYIYHNFLSQDEADYIVKLVEKKVRRG